MAKNSNRFYPINDTHIHIYIYSISIELLFSLARLAGSFVDRRKRRPFEKETRTPGFRGRLKSCTVNDPPRVQRNHLSLYPLRANGRVRREKGVKKRNVPLPGLLLVPNSPAAERERERLDRVAFPVGRPRATIARPAISIRRILGRKVGYRRPVTSAQWGVGIDLNSFGRFLFRPARVHHRNRGGCAVEYFHGSRGNCLPRNENIYSRNSPRNNAVFHPVPSFPLPAINLATMNRHLLLSSFPP